MYFCAEAKLRGSRKVILPSKQTHQSNPDCTIKWCTRREWCSSVLLLISEIALLSLTGWVRTEMKSSSIPASLIGPLSMLPPKPPFSQKGGAQCASQWQFFLLLHTCKCFTVHYMRHWYFPCSASNSITRHLYSFQLNSTYKWCTTLYKGSIPTTEIVYLFCYK